MTDEILKQLQAIPPKDKNAEIIQQQEQMYFFLLISVLFPYQKHKKLLKQRLLHLKKDMQAFHKKSLML